jgi:hypothetical protein
MGTRAGITTDPDTKVLDLKGLLLVDLIEGEGKEGKSLGCAVCFYFYIFLSGGGVCK